jgi:hypothetical protein
MLDVAQENICSSRALQINQGQFQQDRPQQQYNYVPFHWQLPPSVIGTDPDIHKPLPAADKDRDFQHQPIYVIKWDDGALVYCSYPKRESQQHPMSPWPTDVCRKHTDISKETTESHRSSGSDPKPVDERCEPGVAATLKLHNRDVPEGNVSEAMSHAKEDSLVECAVASDDDDADSNPRQSGKKPRSHRGRRKRRKSGTGKA